MSYLIFSDNGIVVSSVRDGGQAQIDHYAVKHPEYTSHNVALLPDGFECGPMVEQQWSYNAENEVLQKIIKSDDEIKSNLILKNSAKIKTRTKELLIDFSYLGYDFNMSEQRQINMADLYQLRYEINKTYLLKINSDPEGLPVYFPINSAIEFDELMKAWREHKKEILTESDDLIMSLSGMTIEELENFADER